MTSLFPVIHVYSLATTWSPGLAKKLTLVYCTVLPCGPSHPESRGLKYVCAWGVRTSKCSYNCCITLLTTPREQGWRSGDNSRLPPTLPEFDSGVVSCMGRVCCCFSSFFFPGSLVFLPPRKQTLPNLNSKYYNILHFILLIYQNQLAWMQFLACHSPWSQMTPFGEKQNSQYWKV